jgi:hypothetical protein
MSWLRRWFNYERPVEPAEPALTPAEALGELFHLWERRGRGYDVFPQPVGLEPSYVPFHALFDRPDLLDLADPYAGDEMPDPQSFVVRLPQEADITPDLAEQFLLALRHSHHPFAFEVVGSEREVAVQWTGSQRDRERLLGQLSAFFPHADASDRQDRLDGLLKEAEQTEDCAFCLVDFGLHNECFQPLHVFTSFTQQDPLQGVIGAMDSLRGGEGLVLQILLTAVRHDWADAFGRAVVGPEGKPLFLDGADYVRFAQAKVERPLFAVVIRVAAMAASPERALDLARRLGGALEQLSTPHSNFLIALSNDNYHDLWHLEDLLFRTTHRVGMLLNSAELCGLVHLPSEVVTHPKLKRLAVGQAPAPTIASERQQGIRLGVNRYRGEATPVSLDPTWRNRHCYVIGATRTGKSTLLLNMIAQDVANGEGVCVIDPHGDLARDILPLIPRHRVDDTISLDFTDRDYPLSLNVLEAASEDERDLICSDLLVILARLFAASWGDRIAHVLRYAILTLLHRPRSTLRDLRRLLSDPAFREATLAHVRDPEVLLFWQTEFPAYAKGGALLPVYNKLGQFLATASVRNVICQPQSKLNLKEAILGRKVIIANLSQGELGEDTAHLLGAMLVSKLQIAAMTMTGRAREERKDFFLYVDEFQNFVTSSFSKILSEAGKAKLGLVIAHQFLDQVDERLRKAILGNVGTVVAFRVGVEDAHKLHYEFHPHFEAKDLLNLQRGQALVRIGLASEAFNLETFPPPSVPAQTSVREIVEGSRARYGTPREEVEAMLRGEGRGGQQTVEGDGDSALPAAPRSGARKRQTSGEPVDLDEPQRFE